jgi:hypothetical protein
MHIESICSGAATYINVRSYLCSNDSTQAYDLTNTLQTVAFQGISARIHATVMGGDCPRELLAIILSGGVPDRVYMGREI